MDYKLGSIVIMKKEHPCKTNEFEIVRVGADIKIKCINCGRLVMMPRVEFNKKIKKLKQTRKDKSYLPEELDYERTIKDNMITTRKELNRVLESLGRFKGKEAFKKVTLPSGQSLTKWEYDELKKEQRIATLRIKKRMNEIKAQRPEYFTGITEGNEEYQRLPL